jgi:hypothetical protein
MQDSFIKGQGKSIPRWFFGYGVPNGGVRAQKEVYNRLVESSTDIHIYLSVAEHFLVLYSSLPRTCGSHLPLPGTY